MFGLGPYFFIEFQRRVTWLFFFLAIMEGLRIYINAKSNGLSNYSNSFGTYLVPTTMGNYNGNVVTSVDGYLMTTISCGIYLIFFVFFLVWQAHYNTCIQEED